MATISDSVRCGRMLKHPMRVEDYSACQPNSPE
jgi:hypothetical protein